MNNRRLEKLHEKRAQIEAQIKDAKTKAAQQERKARDQANIISGAIINKHRDKNHECEHSKWFNRLLDQYVEKPKERERLGLSPLNENIKTRLDSDEQRKNG